jgi:hypothetical protein
MGTAKANQRPRGFPILVRAWLNPGWKGLDTTLLGKHPFREVQALLRFAQLLPDRVHLRLQLLILGLEVGQRAVAVPAPHPGDDDGGHRDGQRSQEGHQRNEELH